MNRENILKKYSLNLSFFISLLAGAIFSISALLTDSFFSVILPWFSSFLMAFRVSREEKYLGRDFYFMGLSFYLIAFYWLYYPIHYFGGFSVYFSVFLSILFSIISAFQFFLTGVIVRVLNRTFLREWFLSLALGWWFVEFLFPRLFPWAFSHTQVSFLYLSYLGEFVGAYPISAIMMWVSSSLFYIFFSYNKSLEKIFNFKSIISLILIFIILVFGFFRTSYIENLILKSSKIKIGVLQGNVDIGEESRVNKLKRYGELSNKAKKRGAKILFLPESISLTWIREDTKKLKIEPYNVLPVLYGGASLRMWSKEEIERRIEKDPSLSKNLDNLYIKKKFNSAILQKEDGEILGIYHKRVLMPFGEYIPFIKVFPFLKNIMPNMLSFDFGDFNGTLDVNIKDKKNRDILLRIAPLICYEDLVSMPSTDGVKNGANILVNMTNDAWYGRSRAMYQHNLLARFRAIETRRFLIRATNTGFSSIISPVGEINAKLEPFKQGVLIKEVGLLSIATLYSRFKDILSYLVSVFVLSILSFLGIQKLISLKL